MPTCFKDGAKSSAELANSTGTHAQSLYRVVRLLAGVGVFAEREDGYFELTPSAACLRSGIAGSMRALALLWGGEEYHAFGSLLDSVKTGKTAFDSVYGMPVFQYLARNPESGKIFDEALSEWAMQQRMAVVQAYDFSRFRRIVDIGGGQGKLLAAILEANPTTHGVLFNMPSVIQRAEQQIKEGKLAERCEIIGGDFFDSVPAGSDAYILSLVIHDWDDERATAILKNCRRAITMEGRVLLVELLLGPRNEPDFEKLSDVYMLAVTGGRERTEREYSELFAAAGFKPTRTIPTQSLVSVIEGVPT